MKIKTFVTLSLLLLLTFSFVGIASAKPASYEACTGDNVSGVVVAVDETTGEITVYTNEGTFCTLIKSTEEYNHPVIALLGEYFAQVSLEELSTNLETLQTWVVFDGTVWDFANKTDPNKKQATVIDVIDNGGTFEITLLVVEEAELQTIIITETLYQEYLSILGGATNSFDLLIDEFGTAFLNDGTMQMGAYHDDGMGLGVLVKLYAMSDAFGTPVDELVTRFKDGEGLGQMFKDESLGKPDLLGVGHVFKELGKNPGHPDGKDNPSASNKSNKQEKEKDKNK